MKSIYKITFISLFFVSHAYSQDGLFWNRYSSGNPAATGVNSDLDVSSLTTYSGNWNMAERLNADIRIKKLHGAIGAGYRFWADSGFGNFRTYNPYLNYSFHVKTGENSLFAFGANVNLVTGRATFPNNFGTGTYTVHRQTDSYGVGAHFQYKRLKIGVALSTYEEVSQTWVEISDMYIDYTFKFGEKWQLHTAAHSGTYRYANRENTIMARAIFKNKYWLGASLGEDKEVGFLVGINLNDHWSIGYSIGAHLSGGYGNYITDQNLSVRFQMPWK